MTVMLELSPEKEAALKVEAQTRGLTVQEWLSQVVENALTREPQKEARRKPLKTGWGTLAQYGQAPSQEEIIENRREMFRGFPRDIG